MDGLVRICTISPAVPQSGGVLEVKSRPAVLLRMLLLAHNPKVPVDGASAIMGIQPSGFGQYLKQLREAFGDDELIKREDGAVYYTGDMSRVDATIVKELYSNVLEIYDEDEDGAMTKEIASQILDSLEKIVELYHGNPAMGLGSFSMDQIPWGLQSWAYDIEQVESDWMELWGNVQVLFANCRMTLHPGRKTGSAVLRDLMRMVRVPSPDENAFCPLLKAAQMSQDIQSHRHAWSLIQDYYDRELMAVPEKLLGLEPPQAASQAMRDTIDSSPLPVSSSFGSSEATRDHVLQIAHLLGISANSTLALRGAEVEPDECIARTSQRLYFSGILASKWVVDDGIRRDFEELLYRLDNNGGDVRFMIINPNGESYEQLFQLRGGRLSKQSVPFLRDLAARHDSFEVRMVDSLPAFRIVVVDDDLVSFSPYTLDAERYASSRRGWQSPHVILDPLAPYPLANAFQLYFEERWLSATPLQFTPSEGEE